MSSYSEKQLECACLLYGMIESKNDLYDVFVHATGKNCDVSCGNLIRKKLEN